VVDTDPAQEEEDIMAKGEDHHNRIIRKTRSKTAVRHSINKERPVRHDRVSPSQTDPRVR